MRIALVHDYLVQYGGAERVLECFMELFPYAPIYTIIYDRASMREKFAGNDIRTSFLQKWPLARRHHRLFPLLMPLAVQHFAFSKYNIFLSDLTTHRHAL